MGGGWGGRDLTPAQVPRVTETCYFARFEDEVLLNVRYVRMPSRAVLKQPPLPPPSPSPFLFQSAEWSFAFPAPRPGRPQPGADNARVVMLLPFKALAVAAKQSAAMLAGVSPGAVGSSSGM